MRAPTGLPLPQPDAASEPFWAACAEKRLLVQHCVKCDAYQSYPRFHCRKCRGKEFDWRQSKGQGRVFTYTVCHHPGSPMLKDQPPYMVVVVKLDDCGGTLLISNLVGEGAERVAVDQPVRLCWDDSAGAWLPRFELAADAGR